MTTIPSNTCPQCGAFIPENSASGLCPRCVFAKALAPTGDGGLGPYVPPSLESVRAAFPHLEITGLIGSGGMGAVFKARQPQLDRFVALKILPAELAGQPGFSDRFQREAQALARLSHPHIVTVHDFGRAGDFYFLLMEFIDGVNLRQLLQTKRLTPKEALSIVPPVCEALQCAHDHGIVHRDIKPENLLIDKAGIVKIADFGIAKIIGSSHVAQTDEPGASREEAGTLALGTPDYAAPEQRDASATTDHRADIYSLGVVLYEMLTGERPTGKLEAPSKRVHVDIRIDEIVLRALEKSPELRFATAAEFRTQVENLNHPLRTTYASSRRGSLWLLTGGVFLALLVELLVVLVALEHKSPLGTNEVLILFGLSLGIAWGIQRWRNRDVSPPHRPADYSPASPSGGGWLLPTTALVLLGIGGIMMGLGAYASQNWGWGAENGAMLAGVVLPLIAWIISGWRLFREPRYGPLGPVPRAIFAVVAALGLFALIRIPGSLWLVAAKNTLRQSSLVTVLAVHNSFSQVVWALQAGATIGLYVWTHRRILGTATKTAARMTAGCFVLLIVHSMLPWVVVASAKLTAAATTPVKSVASTKPKQAASVIRGRILDRTGVVLAECKRLNDRSYPLKTMASGMLGYTAHSVDGLTLIGRSGIEHQYDDVLSVGHDVKLTLDVELQTIAEQALQNARVTKGAFAALDAETGEVLALVSMSQKDLNSLVPREVPGDAAPIRLNGANLAVSPLPIFELFQPVTALSGVLIGRGSDVYRCEPLGNRLPGGGVRYWGTTMACRTSSMENAAHETLTLEQALMKSCSSYFYFLGNTIGYCRVLEMAENLGLQQKVNILGQRTSPVLPNLADFQKQYSSERQAAMQTAEFASGRACMASPLQVASIYATVASGLFCPPMLRMNDPDQQSRTSSRLPSSGAVGDGLASIRRALLRTVSDPDGRAHAAMSSKVAIGGMPVSKRLGSPAMPPGRLMNWAWFAGFATSPRIKLSFALFVEDESAKIEKDEERCAPIMRSILEAWDASQQAKRNESTKSASTETVKPSGPATKPKNTKQPAVVPFKGEPQLRYIAWMPKDETGWQLRTPSGEAVTAPGDIPRVDWEGWKKSLLENGTSSKISDTAGWLMFFYAHPAIDQRSESRVNLFTLAGAKIEVTQRVSGAREPKAPQTNGWLATGCRVPYAEARGQLKASLALTAGSWWSSEPVAAGKTNNSGGGQFLTNSGEDSNHRAFVTVVTEDEDKFPYYQWEVLGRLRDGSDVRSEGSTAVHFQSQYVHTISFGQPLSSYTGFILRHRERRNFVSDGVHVPPVLMGTPESGPKSTLQLRWVRDAPSADTESMTLAGRGQSETLHVEKTVLLDQSTLASVEAIHRPTGSQIELQFTADGKQRFAQVTREGKGRQLAIIIDGRVLSVPIIQAEITGGTAEISGNLSHEEADDLAARLRQAIKTTTTVEPVKKKAQADAGMIFGPVTSHALACAADGKVPYFQLAGGKIFVIRAASAASPEEIQADWEKADAAGGVDFSLSQENGDILLHPHGCAFGEWLAGLHNLFMPASSAVALMGERAATNEVIKLSPGQWPVSCVFRTSRGVKGLMTINEVHEKKGKAALVEFECKLVRPLSGPPQTEDEFRQKANALWEQGDFESVVRVYDEAIKHHTHMAGFFNNRANAHAALKQYEKALADYGEAMKLEPDNDNFFRTRSMAYFQMGDYDRAIADLDLAVKGSPEGVHFDLRGRAYHAKGDFRAALADYERGVQKTPGFTHTFLDLAWLLATCPDSTLRDGQKASQYADLAAVALRERSPEVLAAQAAAHAEQHEYAEAIQLEQEFLKTLPPGSVEAGQSSARLKLYQAHKPLRSAQPIPRAMWR